MKVLEFCICVHTLPGSICAISSYGKIYIWAILLLNDSLYMISLRSKKLPIRSKVLNECFLGLHAGVVLFKLSMTAFQVLLKALSVYYCKIFLGQLLVQIVIYLILLFIISKDIYKLLLLLNNYYPYYIRTLTSGNISSTLLRLKTTTAINMHAY